MSSTHRGITIIIPVHPRQVGIGNALGGYAKVMQDALVEDRLLVRGGAAMLTRGLPCPRTGEVQGKQPPLGVGLAYML